MIHRKKNRPALQRRDILTVSLVSSSTQVLVVVLFLAFHIAWFSSSHFFLGPFLRSLSTQLFFLVSSFVLVLSATAFCYGDFL